MWHRCRLHRLIAIVILISGLIGSIPGSLLSPPPASGGSPAVTLYFYSSEIDITNFRNLKVEFDDYLAQKGHYVFQPFKDRHAFESEIRQCKNGVFLLSAWHYRQLKRQVDLEPMLIGSANGQFVQKRILVGKSATPLDIRAIKGIASASSRTHTSSVFSELLVQRQLPLHEVKVLVVPKDIDAVMSVGFDIANVALTTEHEMNRLKTINPMMHGQLTVLAECADTLLPVIALPAAGDSRSFELLDVVKAMGGDRNGRRRLRLIGLDGWHPVGTAEEKMLTLGVTEGND